MKFSCFVLIALISIAICQNDSVTFPKFLSLQQSNSTQISNEFLTKVTTLLNQKMQIQLNNYDQQVDQLQLQLNIAQEAIINSEAKVQQLQAQMKEFEAQTKTPQQLLINNQPQFVEIPHQVTTIPQIVPSLDYTREADRPSLQSKTQIPIPQTMPLNSDNDAYIPPSKYAVDSYNNGTQDVVQDYQQLNSEKYQTLANQTLDDGTIEIAYSIPVKQFSSETSQIISNKNEKELSKLSPLEKATSPQQRMYISQQQMEVQSKAFEQKQASPRQYVQQQQQFQNQMQAQQQYQQMYAQQQQPMYAQQKPMQGYQQHMQGYLQPMQGYQQPMQGYQQPMQGYQQPMQGYQQPKQAQQPMKAQQPYYGQVQSENQYVPNEQEQEQQQVNFYEQQYQQLELQNDQMGIQEGSEGDVQY